MSKIGTLASGAGAVTVLAGLSQCEQYIMVGDIQTRVLSDLSVEIDGVPTVQLNNSILIAAFAKWKSEMQIDSGVTRLPAVGNVFKVATGMIRKNTTIRMTNTIAQELDIFAFSEAPEGIPILCAGKTILASSYEEFEKFSALFVLESLGTVYEILYKNGLRTTMTGKEIGGLFNLTNQSEAIGQLGSTGTTAGAYVIDNTMQQISSVRITAGSAANVSVAIAKLPDSAFNVLK